MLGERGALLAPLAASASLLLFFYLFPSVQHVLLAGASVAAVWALAFLVQPLADALLQEPRAALPARATRLLQVPHRQPVAPSPLGACGVLQVHRLLPPPRRRRCPLRWASPPWAPGC